MGDLLIQATIAFAVFVAILACILSLLKSGAREDEQMERHYEELAPLAKVYDFPSRDDRGRAA
jgi:hypothetical protein